VDTSNQGECLYVERPGSGFGSRYGVTNNKVSKYSIEIIETYTRTTEAIYL